VRDIFPIEDFIMALNVLVDWLHAATPQQIDKLARLAHTTVGHLRQVAGAYRTEGLLRTTPTLARNLELAAAKIPQVKVAIKREDLCPACFLCEYRKACTSK